MTDVTNEPQAVDPAEALLLDNQLCFPLYACAKEVVRRYVPHLEDLGLTYTQYICMMALWERDGVSVRELGERLLLDSGTLTPLLKKLEVNGENASPLFVELATAKPFEGMRGLKALAMKPVIASVNKEHGDKAYIKWNFTKFLVDRDGNVVARFEPTQDMKDVEKAVGALL